ncbi:UDP-glucose/GDP-mannose dehydrogenase family protein [Corynebacterium sp. HS2168-gen11]|uniref:UDP-glucose dehydrogenase family protein n=1 Tax=Corynebacterium sp. HS2168-gen11 TaxID=2974027 RepID=UPI00216AD14B|nr:UDP-glucose/GDP-mannose dehydrogenase family protein [Corynebacterium sp. HS2168-gen11]MCS4536003.1 UDP-glucose/GDP-mannose dehydrogenase family protein [Corynebacterium sp. HS2168-gen11]
MMEMTVIGLGYLGLTHAACMASLGHTVIGLDHDLTRIGAIASGQQWLYEPGLHDLVEKQMSNGKLRISNNYHDAATTAHLHFLAVGTPADENGRTDLIAIQQALTQLVPLLRGSHVIVGKSTVPAGTCAQLQQLIRSLQHADAQIELVWNPEFLREGNAIADTLHPERIVVGLQQGSSLQAFFEQLYAPMLAEGVPLIVTDWATAELSKVAANAFLALKLSFINAVSDMCGQHDADIGDVAQILGLDSRIGSQYLRAGLGYGGGCLPKDVQGFIAAARDAQIESVPALFNAVTAINETRITNALDDALRLVPTPAGAKIAVLGCAFKPNSDDIRHSPALALARGLSQHAVDVHVYDPKAGAHVRASVPEVTVQETLVACVEDAQLVIIATEWDEFVKLDPIWLQQVVAKKKVLDLRNCLDLRQWQAAGWEYRGIARGHVSV